MLKRIMPFESSELLFNDLAPLPPPINLESVAVFKAALRANRYLAELKGYCQTLPNPEILLNTVALQESRDSSAIENIVTTQDELYQAILNPFDGLSANVKEVISYREAMYTGWDQLKKTGIFNGKLAVRIMQSFKFTDAGFLSAPGTKLNNPLTGQIVYSPPDPQQIADKMAAWEKYINEATDNIDPLVVMALMHYQFEAIHPFADGNSRTGRILNVLLLVHNGLLTLPVLYYSRYIIQHKNNYYRNLRLVTEQEAWEPWILYMLSAVEETAVTTLDLIKRMIALKEETLQQIKGLTQKMPAYELNEIIFSYPYVKIRVLEEARIAGRQTASAYLQRLAELNILRPVKLGREVYYVNYRLMDLLTGAGS